MGDNVDVVYLNLGPQTAHQPYRATLNKRTDYLWKSILDMSASYRTFPLPAHPADSPGWALPVYYSLIEEQSAEDFLSSAHGTNMEKKNGGGGCLYAGPLFAGCLRQSVPPAWALLFYGCRNSPLNNKLYMD